MIGIRDMCLFNIIGIFRDEEICVEVKGYIVWKYMFVFIGVKFLLGVGIMFLFIFGLVYIDENVNFKVVFMYFGVWFMVMFFGFGIGYVVGGLFLNVWVDFI